MSASTKGRTKMTTKESTAAGKRSGSMIRVPEATHDILRDIANETGESMQDVLVRAVEQLRRRRMFERANDAYLAMRRDPTAWQAELDERVAWDVTLSDGLEDW